eukprot:scaffold251908_cov10-Tisochrysis_lutea.AAC.1
MKKLGCCTDGQRQEIDTADRACPACASFNGAQRIDRECQPGKELVRATWMPSWEPEESKEA